MMQKNIFKKKTFDLATEIQAIAKNRELGELRKIYPVMKQNTAHFGVGMLCIVFNIMLLSVTISMMILAELSPFLAAAIIFIAIILFFIGFYLTLSQKIYASWSVSLWKHGFIYEKKRVIQVFRWNQIESILQVIDPFSQPGYKYKIRRHDGYEAILGYNFANITELIDSIIEEIAPYLIPEESGIRLFNNIQKITMFNFDRQGISNSQEALSWKEIQMILIKDGEIMLHKKEKQGVLKFGDENDGEIE